MNPFPQTLNYDPEDKHIPLSIDLFSATKNLSGTQDFFTAPSAIL
jgi:hypothetical protein